MALEFSLKAENGVQSTALPNILCNLHILEQYASLCCANGKSMFSGAKPIGVLCFDTINAVFAFL